MSLSTSELWLPELSITPTRLCAYMKYVGDRSPVRIKISGSQLRLQQQHMSTRSIARLRRCVELLTYTASWKKVYCRKTGQRFRYKINFITLTLSSRQLHSDSVIVRELLSPFLKAWARRRPGLLYVWKAEVQDNGNIHFHITANAFYHHKKLRADWNRFQERLGYISRSGLDNPNSTDVHSCKNAKKLAAYLAAYVCKKDLYSKVLKRYLCRYRKNLSDQSRLNIQLPKNYFRHIKRHVTCARWSASKELLGAKCTASGHDQDIQQLMNLLSHKSVPWIDTDHCRLLYIEPEVTASIPALNNRLMAKFSRVFTAQALIPVATEVDEL